MTFAKPLKSSSWCIISLFLIVRQWIEMRQEDKTPQSYVLGRRSLWHWLMRQRQSIVLGLEHYPPNPHANFV